MTKESSFGLGFHFDVGKRLERLSGSVRERRQQVLKDYKIGLGIGRLKSLKASCSREMRGGGGDRYE